MESGNTLQSFMLAQRLGVTGIEIDIYLDYFGDIIVCHPGDDEKYAIKFEDLLDFMETFKDMICLADFKQNSTELVEIAGQMISERNLEERFYMTAFQQKIDTFTMESDGQLLLYSKRKFPDIKTHVMAVWPFNLAHTVRKYQVDAISFGWLQEPEWIRLIGKCLFKSISNVTNFKNQIKKAKTAREAPVKIWAGVFNDPNDILYFYNIGVDGIVTDSPEMAMKLAENQKIS